VTYNHHQSHSCLEYMAQVAFAGECITLASATLLPRQIFLIIYPSLGLTTEIIQNWGKNGKFGGKFWGDAGFWVKNKVQGVRL